ncbi:TonB-dependent receptor plug domain-containing protein [Pontibacter sp. Tf4]|uniref:TonB-dependent receptor plug domain-containing protein n=1 Tax=Pontibacter sp. Tf4 TaxID=2761620 RepID=UPI0016278DDD|nr:TonB-dependent receptor plug domain-containing protein [Pontibacter sp. Tf4]MBB6610266.1 TonB-dependent receptor plug domain-containing protein [Pontibacter sp. Tf4]
MKQTLRTAGTLLVLLGCTFTAIAQTTDSLTTQQVQGVKTDEVTGTPYGTRNESEITDARLTKALNKGFITTPEQLLTGKYSGLQVVQGSGKPGAAQQMVFRNGTTIYGSNAPLIVIDGVPLLDATSSNHAGYLSFINPSDMTSVVLLKDAAINSVFGAAAANGVLYITTLSGTGSAKPKVTFSTTGAVSFLPEKHDVLSAGQFREIVQREYPDKVNLLGNHTTDWQDEIYRKAFSQDHTLQVKGNVGGFVPYAVSANYLNHNGILKTSQHQRTSVALSVAPSLIDEHLKIKLNLRKADQKLRVADERAILAALTFDPTQPVHANNNYGNYFTYLTENGEAHNYATPNPLSLLEQRHDQDKKNTLYGQAHVNYKLHFLPQLSVNARYVLHNQDNNYSSWRPAEMASVSWYKGWKQKDDGKLNYSFKEAYLAYDQELNSLKSALWLVAGANWQTLDQEINNHPAFNTEGTQLTGYSFSSNSSSKKSVYGQLGLTVLDRYSLNASISNWKTYSLPGLENAATSLGAGVAWELGRENFLANSPVINSLKLYSNYSRFLNPEHSSLQYNNLLQPSGVKLESVKKWNAGLNFALLNSRLSGNVNYYSTTTSDMFLLIQQWNGNGYNSRYVNVGEFITNGLEADLNYKLLATDNLTWSLGANVWHGTSEVTSLMREQQLYIVSAGGNNKMVLGPGHPLNSFYLYKQLYNEQGQPIEGSYEVDKNGNPKLEVMGQKSPKLQLGLHSDVSYKKFSASVLVRAASGHNVFNGIDSNYGNLSWLWGPDYLENISGSYNETGFSTRQASSSYYLQVADFVKLEYLQLGYQLGTIWKDRANLSLTATLQNALLFTKYKGQNPEVQSGFDYGQYPYPTTVSVGLKIEL